MTHDINVLRAWIRIVLIVAAICTTAVPLLYSFSPWRSRRLGQLFMLQAVSFAVAIDLSLLFSYWRPKTTEDNILLLFWVDASVLTMIAISTAALAWMMVLLNYRKKKGRKDE